MIAVYLCSQVRILVDDPLLRLINGESVPQFIRYTVVDNECLSHPYQSKFRNASKELSCAILDLIQLWPR